MGWAEENRRTAVGNVERGGSGSRQQPGRNNNSNLKTIPLLHDYKLYTQTRFPVTASLRQASPRWCDSR